MQERDKLLSDLKSILISLYFTYSEPQNDIEIKERLIDHALDVIDEVIIQSFEYDEPRYELIRYLINKVAERFGQES